MIRIRPIQRDPPNTAWWPDGHKPEYCYSPCRRGCRATQAITIWNMVWTYLANRDIPFTGHGHPDTHIFAQAIDFYMDQYGCVAVGLGGTEKTTRAQGILFPGFQEYDVSKLWGLVRDQLIWTPERPPDPGTITLLPSIESIVHRLQLAADYGA